MPRTPFADRASRLAGALVVALLLVLPRPILAAGSPRISLSFGLGGVAAPGRWNPLRIACGGPLELGLIEVIRGAEDGSPRSIELFPYSEDTVLECPAFLDDGLHSLTVRLTAAGRLLAEERIGTRVRLFPGHIVACLGVPPAVRAALGRMLFPVEPVQAPSLSLAELPLRALDYDGASALVLRDPGPALSPPRVEALRLWIAGGGRLVLLDAPEPRRSLASILLPGAWPQPLRVAGLGFEARGLELGAGRILFAPEEAAALAPADADAFWAGLLRLEPFAKSARFTPGQVFPEPSFLPVEAVSTKARDLPALAAFAAWALLALVLARRARGRSAGLALASLLALAAAISAAPLLGAAGRRDARASARLLVLPGGEGFIAGLSARLPLYPEGDILSPVLARRKVALGLGLEEGRLDGEGLPRWSHAGSLAYASLREGSPVSLDLVLARPGTGAPGDIAAALRGAAPAGMPPSLRREARVAFSEAGDRSRWWIWEGPGPSWRLSAEPPPWLGSEASWLAGLRAAFPGRGFFVGREAASGLGFSILGKGLSDLAWALPSSPERGGREAW